MSGVRVELRSWARAVVRMPAVMMANDDDLVRHGVVVDASVGGACVETREPLVEGLVLVLKLRHEPDLPAVVARVVWTSNRRAGLTVLGNRAHARAAWALAFAPRTSPRAA